MIHPKFIAVCFTAVLMRCFAAETTRSYVMKGNSFNTSLRLRIITT
jgi:hypothetical protein